MKKNQTINRIRLKSHLKILFLPAWYPGAESEVSGIFIREHARAVSLYNEVIVLNNEMGTLEDGKRLSKIISDQMEEGVRTIRIKYRPSAIPGVTYLRYLFSVITSINKIISNGWFPDIIHAHVYSAGCPAVIMKMKYKIPVVITEHSSGFVRRNLTFRYRLKARMALNMANIVLPVSENLQEAIQSYGFGDRFQVIPNVVDTSIFYPVVEKKECGSKRILFVGSLNPLKGVPQLLTAISRLKCKRRDFILDIVGDGPYREAYEQLMRELKLQEMVVFHGCKNKQNVAEFMRNCDFIVLPSLYETFSVTCIEALACGKPVIASRLPVFQEKINKERGILVPVENEDALVEAIDTMLDSYFDYSTEKISSYVYQKYSYEVVGSQICNIYREVLSYAKRRTPK